MDQRDNPLSLQDMVEGRTEPYGFDMDKRTVEEVRQVKVLAYDGPDTVGAKRSRCEHCQCSIISVQFAGRDELEWFHTNTRYKVCQGGATEATPVDA